MIKLTIPDKDILPIEDGPWIHETDFVRWICPSSGYECVVVRVGFTFALCGYVGVPDHHPLHGLHYHDDILSEYIGKKAIKVHGGLTYSDTSIANDFAFEKKPASSWFFGFDCSHSCDISPAIDFCTEKNNPFARLNKLMEESPFATHKQYRTMAYVKQQVSSLALQLEAANIDISGPLGLIMNASIESENSIDKAIKAAFKLEN